MGVLAGRRMQITSLWLRSSGSLEADRDPQITLPTDAGLKLKEVTDKNSGPISHEVRAHVGRQLYVDIRMPKGKVYIRDS